MKKKTAVILGPGCVAAVILVLWSIGIFSSQPRPNIVLIIIDALRGDRLGCCGFNGDISPEIDEMARNGVLFEDVTAQSSWTRPSIGSLLTARYPRSIGIYKEKFDILADDYLTFAEILKENRYTTIGITANPNINNVFNFHQGFDDYVDSSVTWSWMKSEPGKRKTGANVPLPKSGEVFDTVLKKVKRQKKEKVPVYIQVNIMEVHSPYLIRDDYKRLFRDYTPGRKNKYYPEEEIYHLITGTHGAVRQCSHDIGVFVKRLLAIPGCENTLFIITSDHGQGLDDHPDVKKGISHGFLLYESHLKVPLILYHANGNREVFKHKRIKQRIRLMDTIPTVLDYIGIAPPENIQGKSVLGIIANDEADSRLPDYYVAETGWRDVAKIAVYSDQWKYIENYDHWQGVNIFELQAVGQRENGKLTDKIHVHPAIAKKLKRILNQWKKKFPKVKATQPAKKPGQKETDQLKTLGYLD